jgi:hypothetical protein
MSILDTAISHFETLETKVIEVPEWDAMIYTTPFTLAEKKKLLRSAKEDEMEFLVRVLIMKALDAKGNNVFDLSNKPTLMNKVSPDVLIRVVNEISASPSVEDQLGN